MTLLFANKLSNLLARIGQLHKFRIPTLLGLGLVLVGIGLGVYLVNQNQGLTAQASPDQAPQDVIISNIEEDKVTLSWQTTSPSTSIITYGINSPDEQTTLDDRDDTLPRLRNLHYFTIKNLTPQTTYQYKIIFGKSSTNTSKFTTAKIAASQNNLKPIIGTTLQQNQPLQDGVIYLTASGSITQSVLVKNGNFIIPISLLRRDDLEDIFIPQENTQAKLTIISDTGVANALINLSNSQLDKPINIGDNLDFTKPVSTPTVTPFQDPNLLKYDLNNDQLINTSDYAIILKNFGKSPQDKRADLNGDGIVDQKDLSEMSKKITEQKR